MIVFCAEITITGRPGLSCAILGSISSPLPSGMITSEITTSPLPSPIQRISVVSELVACTLHPARVSAWVRTVRIVRSSSATSTVPSICLVLRGLWHFIGRALKRDPEHRPPRHRTDRNPAIVIRDNLRCQCQPQTRAVLAPRDERVEYVLGNLGRKSRPVIDHLDLQGQRLAVAIAAPHPQRLFVIS